MASQISEKAKGMSTAQRLTAFRKGEFNDPAPTPVAEPERPPTEKQLYDAETARLREAAKQSRESVIAVRDGAPAASTSAVPMTDEERGIILGGWAAHNAERFYASTFNYANLWNCLEEMIATRPASEGWAWSLASMDVVFTFLNERGYFEKPAAARQRGMYPNSAGSAPKAWPKYVPPAPEQKIVSVNPKTARQAEAFGLKDEFVARANDEKALRQLSTEELAKLARANGNYNGRKNDNSRQWMKDKQ